MKNNIVNVTMQELNAISLNDEHQAISQVTARALPMHPGENQKILLFTETGQVKALSGDEDITITEAPPEEQTLSNEEAERAFDYFVRGFKGNANDPYTGIMEESIRNFLESRNLESAHMLYKFGEFMDGRREDDIIPNILLHAVPAMQPELLDFLAFQERQEKGG